MTRAHVRFASGQGAVVVSAGIWDGSGWGGAMPSSVWGAEGLGARGGSTYPRVVTRLELIGRSGGHRQALMAAQLRRPSGGRRAGVIFPITEPVPTATSCRPTALGHRTR